MTVIQNYIKRYLYFFHWTKWLLHNWYSFSRSIITFITGPLLLFTHYLDLIKDICLIIQLQLVLGGATIFIFYDRFSSMVIFKFFSLYFTKSSLKKTFWNSDCISAYWKHSFPPISGRTTHKYPVSKYNFWCQI